MLVYLKTNLVQLPVLLLYGHEQLSKPFCYQLHCESQTALETASLVNSYATVTITVQANSQTYPKYISGYISAVKNTAISERGCYHYQFTLRPCYWPLALCYHSHTFRQLNPIDIIQQLFNSHQLCLDQVRINSDSLQQDYPAIPYCIQYRETDLDFLSRLLAEHGIYYYSHTLLQQNSVQAQYVLFDDPNQLPIQHHPELAQLINWRVQHSQGQSIWQAHSRCAELGLGMQIQPMEFFSEPLVVTHVAHSYRLAAGYSGAEQRGMSYQNHCRAIPSSMLSAVTKAKPTAGAQITQITTMSDATAITCDALGAVKTQFAWDKDAPTDANSSDWVANLQYHADNGWGQIFLPRRGQRVCTVFLQGDVQRGYNLGSIYCQEAQAPECHYLPTLCNGYYTSCLEKDTGQDLQDGQQIHRQQQTSWNKNQASSHLSSHQLLFNDQRNLLKLSSYGDFKLQVSADTRIEISQDYQHACENGGMAIRIKQAAFLAHAGECVLRTGDSEFNIRDDVIQLRAKRIRVLADDGQAGAGAARVGDLHACPQKTSSGEAHVGGPIVTGSGNVVVNGRAAARVGDAASCQHGGMDVVASGHGGIRVNGCAAVSVGDLSAHGGVVSVGSGDVSWGSREVDRHSGEVVTRYFSRLDVRVDQVGGLQYQHCSVQPVGGEVMAGEISDHVARFDGLGANFLESVFLLELR